jgi:hypothetical protein
MSTSNQQPHAVTLEIHAHVSDRPADLRTIVAYAFSQGGALLGMKVLDEEGRARIEIQVGHEGQLVRVVLGPELAGDDVTVAEVLRRGGIERHVPVRPDMQRIPPVVFDVTPDIWRVWLGRFCAVNGTLVKRTLSGGVVLNLPVCNATVDIYEIDPWPIIIGGLSDVDLDRLRDIVDGPWPPIHWPVPPRPPEVFLNPQPLPPRAEMAAAPPLPADLVLAARAERPFFERAVLANLDLLRPILCWLYPFIVRKTKIATVTTDECGRFHALVWRSVFNFDQPDLYFTARQRIWPGIWVDIYAPTPIVCHTWWNYVCGTEVTLVTRHPLARTCLPCPPVVAPRNWVLFMAIGNTSVWRIHGANLETMAGAPGHDAARVGLLDGTAPWGGTLRPRLEFDNALRGTLGVYYYRVAYKRATEPESAWRPSFEAVNRHYIHDVGGEPVLEQYPLGPRTVGATPFLYEIPPALPPSGQWSSPNLVLDNQSAVFPTADVAPGVPFDAFGVPTGADQGGLWQIKVELFDAAGNMVDPEALGIKWRVPESFDLSGTITTLDAAALGLVDAALNRMVVPVRIDNNPTYARIDAPTVGGSAAADACGVMRYTSRALPVGVPFEALQINRYASYSFYVQRGAVTPPEYSIAGTAAASLATMSAALPPSPPADAPPTVDSLLDACTLAGFTEQLYVAHMGTDGWRRLSEYDRSAVRAFVLAPA